MEGAFLLYLSWFGAWCHGSGVVKGHGINCTEQNGRSVPSMPLAGTVVSESLRLWWVFLLPRNSTKYSVLCYAEAEYKVPGTRVPPTYMRAYLYWSFRVFTWHHRWWISFTSICNTFGEHHTCLYGYILLNIQLLHFPIATLVLLPSHILGIWFPPSLIGTSSSHWGGKCRHDPAHACVTR
jgi:hypothetical protein